METLFTRAGTEFHGKVQTDEKGRPFAEENYPCSRCGGQGGWAGWPGFTCYRCCNERPMIREYSKFPLYTAAQLVTLNSRKEAAAERKAAREQEKRVANFAAAIAGMPEEVRVAYDWALNSEDTTAQDIASKVETYGPLSEKQAAFLVKLHGRAVKRAEEQAAAQDCPSGRLTVSGTILSLKWVDGQFGSTLKMLVRDDRGFKVWGTAPRTLDAIENGARVEFVAAVEPSRDDKFFGLFSRPTKARIREA